MYDVIIIGGGVTGCCIAREVSKQKRKVLVLEQASDVCEGTSKANSGIVHAGYDAAPGSLKAKLNVQGNEMMGTLAKELDFPFKRSGSFVLMFDENDRSGLEKLLEKGKANGVPDLQILSKEQVLQKEPNLSENLVAALYAPTAGIVCPFGLTVAMAENAATNGVEFSFDTEVMAIEAIQRSGENGAAQKGYQITTNKGTFEAALVINAAGVYADKLHNMVSEKKLHITARRGEYCLMDKAVGNYVGSTIFQLPGAKGKGVLVTPTVHGNLLVGPNAEDVEDKEAVNTTADGLEDILKRGSRSVKEMPRGKVITSFAGLRAHEDGGDFIIGEVEDAKGFIDVAGIESPGLSSAPAIGVYVAQLLQQLAPVEEKQDFIATRKGIPNMATLSMEEREKLIAQNPAYANVICRCELVTEGEIVDAIHRPVGATTLDGIKRRTRAGMGRCQAGFCSPKTVEILARELGVAPEKITKMGGTSAFITGQNKEGL